MAAIPADLNAAVKRALEAGAFTREVPPDLDIALPKQVADLLDTTEPGLAQMRYRGTGPKFIKAGKKVLYRWSDVRAYLDANTLQRTDDPRGTGAA